MREIPRLDLALAFLPRIGSTAIDQMEIISIGSNRKFYCKSATKPSVHRG
jgi:hypothetical protein